MREPSAAGWILAMAALSFCAPTLAAEPEPPVIEVSKLATCVCCRPWIKYMESEGFRVHAQDVSDLPALKREKGIPAEHSSCHTAVLDGYVLEGHVSADDVRRLLKERPDIVGLIVEGMPKGAPGIEGPDPVAYDVLALAKDGTVSVYATHTPTEPSTATATADGVATP